MDDELGAPREQPTGDTDDPQGLEAATASTEGAVPEPAKAGRLGVQAEDKPESGRPGDLESRIREIGETLFAALSKEGRMSGASSFLGGRAMQRRILARAVEDPHFKTQLFRFVDVYPSLRDSGDVVRHVRAYLADDGDLPRPLDRLVGATSGPRLPTWAVARLTERGMERMAKSLIPGRDATEAIPTLKNLRRHHCGFTLDILGEACVSESEASAYLRRYLDVLDILPPRTTRWSSDLRIDESPWGQQPRVNLSLKLSSLYSQIDALDFEGSRQALVHALRPLFIGARNRGAFVNIDLERFAHRDLTYAVFADLVLDEDLRDYPHMGVVVQAYLRDSQDDLQNLVDLARRRGTPFTVRLVKGAYWDYETIVAAQEHWPSPVFAHKAETDIQFEKLTELLIENWEWTRPALATHNIRSVAAAIAIAEAADLPSGALELQFLFGIADSIRNAAAAQGQRVREYVPVGESIPGMAYFVRRLLENTANESFLRLTFLQHQDPAVLLAPPVLTASEPDKSVEEFREKDKTAGISAPPEPLAREAAPGGGAIIGLGHPMIEAVPPFQNEPHTDFCLPSARAAMQKALTTIRGSLGRDYALLIGEDQVRTGKTLVSINPARPSEVVGRVASGGRDEADRALDAAQAAFPLWRDTPVSERAGVLLRAAGLMRARRFELAALEVVEAGKPWREADGDVTEAIDFLEYYAREVLRLAPPRNLSDVPGEDDQYLYEPRGVAAVIAPWNFPLAIPTGMVSAALAAGNTVVFKPASSTPVLGYALVRMLREAGVPDGAVNYLPGPGADVGEYLAADPRVDLIVFTGSLEVGQTLLKQAAVVAPGQRNIKKIVAELGGKNAIIVDADADLDAAVEGVISSAFNYSGQKCSACSRVIVLREVHDQFVHRLTQAAASLKVGDPSDPGARVGPVITGEARDRILAATRRGKHEAALAFPPEGWTLPKPDYTVLATTPLATMATAVATSGATTSESTVPADSALPDETTPAAGPRPTNGPVATPESAPASGPAPATEPPSAAEQAPPVEPATSVEPGYFIPPHVFVDVPPEASLAQEEIFGPVLAVMKAQDFGHALELALQVRYGLTGGVYSRNPAHIARAYHEFRVGNLYINRPITGAMVGRQPFGGSRMSGVGSKAGGPDYLLQFLEPRTVTENAIRRGFAPTDEIA